MAICPHGHDSPDGEFCHVCGTRIGGDPVPGGGRTVGRHHLAGPDAVADGPAPPARSSAPPTRPIPKFTPATWTALVGSDRDYYDKMRVLRDLDWSSTAFPAPVYEQRIPLAGPQMRIGRRSEVRDLEPEIDLAAPAPDPGISRLHALLIARPDGSWAVLDPGSANGTLVNGRRIATGDLIPLREGDRINLGVWTAITIQRGLGTTHRPPSGKN